MDCLIFVENGLGVHVQRMLKMSRGLYTGGIFLAKHLEKSKGKLGTLFAILIWQINDLVPTYFCIKLYYALTACTTTTFTFGKC